MAAQTPTMHSLASRIETLERSSRRRRVLIIALVITAVTPLLLGQGAAPAAESLELRDAEGDVYASITHTAEAGAALILHDDKQRDRITLRVGTDGVPSIRLIDRAGTDRVELALLDESTPRLLLRDDAGTERAKLLLMPEGSPLLYLKDATGTTRVELASLWTGLDGMVIFDAMERPRMLRAAQPDAGVSLRLADTAGVVRLTAGVDPRGTPLVETAGEDGRITWQVPPPEDVSPEPEKKPSAP